MNGQGTGDREMKRMDASQKPTAPRHGVQGWDGRSACISSFFIRGIRWEGECRPGVDGFVLTCRLSPLKHAQVALPLTVLASFQVCLEISPQVAGGWDEMFAVWANVLWVKQIAKLQTVSTYLQHTDFKPTSAHRVHPDQLWTPVSSHSNHTVCIIIHDILVYTIDLIANRLM